MSPRSRRIARLVPAALAAGMLAVLTSACASSAAGTPASSPISTQASKYKGTELGKPVTVPAVTLTDTSGRPYDLKARSAGKVTLLYFGYTNCPDVCPTTMGDIAAALRLLPAGQRDKVSVVFVTTDPDRDTAPVLKAWLAKFDPSFVGLTGTVAQVDNAASLASVPVSPPVKQADGTIEVDHGAQTTAFAANGVAPVVWLEGVTTQDMVHDISVLIAQGP